MRNSLGRNACCAGAQPTWTEFSSTTEIWPPYAAWARTINSEDFPLFLLGGDTRLGDLRSKAATPFNLKMFLGKGKVFWKDNFILNLPKYIDGRLAEKEKTEKENYYDLGMK